ncbi:hypothetical protein K469DRAFT_368515 [Zopfia rhizophila CBS 207.26]|uniref:Uncharacterized protein n=1 Tax=Zopfia rhizophila CBS 207.26 TaxID=1314779 RepID=A0A6A6EGY5_9PEZI|nr:hypothetical protein K469DRAFT_368515 [Zopfia rhizophila CBS 207.26]
MILSINNPNTQPSPTQPPPSFPLTSIAEGNPCMHPQQMRPQKKECATQLCHMPLSQKGQQSERQARKILHQSSRAACSLARRDIATRIV